jgi:tetratricopeptide (TPR) repeat protein
MFQLLVNFYKNTNRVQLLMTDLNKQIETNPESRLYYYRGVLYDEQKKGDLAMADYRKAVELDEFNYDACYNLGAAIKNYNVSDIYDQLAKSNITPARKKELKLKMVETYKEARKYLEVAATNQNYSVEDLTNLYEALVQCAIEQGDDEATKEFKDKLSALKSSAAK